MINLVQAAAQALEKAAIPSAVVALLSTVAAQATVVQVAPEADDRAARVVNGSLVLNPGDVDPVKGLADLVQAFGDLIFEKARPDVKEIWLRKLTLAKPEIAKAFNDKLARGNFSSYQSLVESFSGSIERLVAVHVANALIGTGVSIKDANNLDVTTWPVTAEFASGRKPYSLIPLLGAYCDGEQLSSYGVAFRHLVSGTLKCSRSDVGQELKALIELVAEQSA